MLKIAKKNNNLSIDNVITRICNVVFATLPSNLFSPIDSHILDFEIFSENHNFIPGDQEGLFKLAIQLRKFLFITL
jgi:hypothetical protein